MNKNKNDKEEIISLTDNKEIKKKKFKKINLQNVNVGTKPIGIFSSKYDFFNLSTTGSKIKAKIRLLLFIPVILIVFIVLFVLRGKFHKQKSDMTENLQEIQNATNITNITNINNINNITLNLNSSLSSSISVNISSKGNSSSLSSSNK